VALVLLVKKKTEGIRLCMDLKKLKSIKKKYFSPLPRIDDVLDLLLHGQNYFSTLDFASGYCKIEMDDSSKEKTASSWITICMNRTGCLSG
jgi:hypothetical protein